MVECELARIIIDEHRDEQVIFLREIGGERTFPILIGIFEATQIDRILKERRARRPLTHDLLLESVKALGGRLASVRIEDFREDIFFAKLALERPGEPEAAVDARPSDAVALALMAGVPIYVAESVLEQSARPGDPTA